MVSAGLFGGVSERAVNVEWPPKTCAPAPEGVQVWIDGRETGDFSIAPDGAVRVHAMIRSQVTIRYHQPAVWGPTP